MEHHGSQISRRSFVQSSLAAVSAAALAKATTVNALAGHSKDQIPLRFGVNYVPRKRWWYCWLDWDQQSVADDLQAIAALGMDHVRVQCLWPYFQPGVNVFSDAVLDRLHALLDSADRAGLDVEVTVLNGWMSGFSFMPSWTTNFSGRRNMFTDPAMIAGEKLLFAEIAERISTHPRFLGFDIGNELGVLLNSNPVTSQQADAWADEIFKVCYQVAPGKIHVNGVDHEHWFADYGFTRENLATSGAVTIAHCYAYFTGALTRYGYSGVGTLHLVEYMIELAYAYHTDLSRRVWVEEVGVSPNWVPESYVLEYADHTVRNAVSTGKTWGITWWCSHDIDPSIKGFDSLEYTLGLIDQNNEPKPLGKKLAALASELRNTPFNPKDRQTALVLPDRGLSPTPFPLDWKYGEAFMRLLANGEQPCIVLESRAMNEGYLRSRGITKLIPFTEVKP